MHVLCASTLLLGSHGGSGLVVHSSHPPHIATHHIHEYQISIRWISVPSRPSAAQRELQKKGILCEFLYLCRELLHVVVVVAIAIAIAAPPHCIEFPLPLILIVPTLVHLAVLGVDVLGEALAPLHRLAEPELLLVGISGVGAHAADKDCLPCAVLAAVSPLPSMILLALFLVHPPDHRRCSRGVVLTRCRSSCHARILLVVDELVRESSKELEAAHRPLVCMDNLLEKKVGVDANDAEDTKVQPLVPPNGSLWHH